MHSRTRVRAITLTIALTLAMIVINLQADIAAPVFSAETPVLPARAAGDEGAGPASYPADLRISWQLCPC